MSFFKKLFLLIFFIECLITKAVSAEVETFLISPLCERETITCPDGYEAACADKISNDTKPKCLFYGDKYIPGCWKFVGIKKLDFSLFPANMPPTTMVKITGGGEVYTLNREIIGCRKL